MNEIYYIEWTDSISFHGWIQKEEVTCKPPVISTIAYVIMENDDCITVSPSISEYSVDSPITIPKVCLIHRQRIDLKRDYA